MTAPEHDHAGHQTAATSEMIPVDNPPRKRYRFTLTLDVHDFDHLADELRRMAHDADMGNIPAERVSGGGYWFTCQEVDPTMTKERFEGELSSWFDRRRGARRGR